MTDPTDPSAASRRTGASFDPRVLDRTVVARPLLEQIERLGDDAVLDSGVQGDHPHSRRHDTLSLPEPYGGLGRNGAQKTPGAQTVTLAAPGTAYGFASRGIYNLDGNAVIDGHSDLANAEIGYAIVSAMATIS